MTYLMDVIKAATLQHPTASSVVISKLVGCNARYVRVCWEQLDIKKKHGRLPTVVRLKLSREYFVWLETEAGKIKATPNDIAVSLLNDAIADAMEREQSLRGKAA